MLSPFAAREFGFQVYDSSPAIKTAWTREGSCFLSCPFEPVESFLVANVSIEERCRDPGPEAEGVRTRGSRLSRMKSLVRTTEPP